MLEANCADSPYKKRKILCFSLGFALMLSEI